MLSTACGMGVVSADDGIPVEAVHAAPPQHYRPRLSSAEITVLCENLSSPDGIVLHPQTGRIFVAEEMGNRIRVLEDGRRDEVIHERTPVYRLANKNWVADEPLRAPEGIALSDEGELYVAEDRPGGRLLVFPPGTGGTYPAGKVVDLPGTWPHFAWEGVDVGPRGELLLAGSDLEWIIGRGRDSPPTGVLLYRDPDGLWWIAMEEAIASFSAVEFTPDGTRALFACEVSGAIGWLDVRDGGRRVGTSSVTAFSPEDLCVIPDGRVVIAEEGGSIICVDPAADRYELIAERLGDIESVCLDVEHDRLLVTADGSGRVLAIPFDAGRDAGIDRLALADWHENIPYPLPGRGQTNFLSQVLAFVSVDFEREARLLTPGRAFAENVPLIALRATTQPLTSPRDTDDPIAHIEFVMLNPQAIPVDIGGTPLAYAGFMATTRSGRVIEVRATNMVAQVSAWDRPGFPPSSGEGRVPSHMGTMSVHFIGMGRLPSYSLILDNRRREDSLLVVGALEEPAAVYRLAHDQPAGWLVAYADRFTSAWKVMAVQQ